MYNLYIDVRTIISNSSVTFGKEDNTIAVPSAYDAIIDDDSGNMIIDNDGNVLINN